jgi:LysR family cyn operon transcriptional activator
MRRYTLAQLDALRCVVTFKGFQEAADHLSVTQPTISLRIRELEAIVGYRLLRRSGGKGELTAEGAIFYQYVEQLTKTLSEMDRRMRTGDPLRGVLRMGASDTFAISCLPELLTRMESIYPDLRVELTIARSTALAELLNAKLLDIAFMVETALDPGVRVHPLAYCRMAWFGHVEGGRLGRPLCASDLEGKRLMSLPVGSPLYNLMTQWFESAQHPLPSLSICNSLAIILRLINAGHAWSILPECFTLSNDPLGLPSPFTVIPELPMLKLCVAYRTESNVDTLLPVVDHVKDILQGTPGLLPLE